MYHDACGRLRSGTTTTKEDTMPGQPINPTLWLDDDVDDMADAFDRIFQAHRLRRDAERRGFFTDYYEAD